MAEVGPKIEIEPRAKILFFQLTPGKIPHLQMAEAMFGQSGSAVEDFRQMVASEIKTTPKDDESDFQKREATAQLPMPEAITNYRALVITGSPFTASPRETDEQKLFVAQWKWDLIKLIRAAVEHDVPVLGICFGEQILAEALGGKVVKMRDKDKRILKEVGWSLIKRAPGSMGDPIMEGLPSEFVAAENHIDIVARLPEGSVLLAENECGVQGFRIEKDGRPIAWGFEFHPERPPADVEKLLKEDAVVQRIKKEGRDPDQILALGQKYSPVVTKIFSNFLKHIWSGAQ